MNRILAFLVVLLIPMAIVTKGEDKVVMADTLGDAYSLEVKFNEELEENNNNDNNNGGYQVLISNNKNKSNPYYMDLEEYIIGVVAGEMPASFDMEALKAQAVAARSFAINKMMLNNNYVLSTTINDQVYINEDAMKSKWKDDYQYYYERVKQAVMDTKGEVLTYNGNVISAYYFAISNGYTDNALNVFNEDKKYLVSVESSWDKNYQSYKSVKTITKSSFLNKLGLSGDKIWITDINRASNNYIRSLVINGKSFTGIEVFNKLGLKSTDFRVEVDGDNAIITTYGFGHGVGMSQYGAQGMAKEGYNYQDILKYYYQNTDITNI